MMSAYCASKSGVEAYAHSLRGEVGHRGVKVGVGYLSWTDTDMVRGADQDDVHAGVARSGCPGRRTRPIRWARRSTGWWRASSAAPRTSTGSGGCAACRACAAICRAVIGTVGQREMRRFGDRLNGRRIGLVGAGGAADEHRPTSTTTVRK